MGRQRENEIRKQDRQRQCHRQTDRQTDRQTEREREVLREAGVDRDLYRETLAVSCHCRFL